MKRKPATRLVAAMTIGALSLALTACDQPQDGSGGEKDDSAAVEGAADLRVGLAYDIGGRGDKSFNDSAYRGLQRVDEELGVAEVTDQEPSEGEADSAKVDRLSTMAEQGFNVVIGVGFAYAEPMKEVAPNYPDVHFAIVDEEIEGIDNVTSLVFAEQEASFLVGAAAALKTTEDHVGFIGGVETPLIQKFEAGYYAGAQHINSDIEIAKSYLSQPPDMGGFQDPARGKSVAQGQYDKGVDVIYHAAGASGTGVLEAATAEKKQFIGVDSDQYKSASEEQKPYVLTSAIKRVDTAVFDYVKSVAEGSVKPGVQRFDLASDGVDFSTSNKEGISDIQGQLDDLKQQIIDGEIDVPTKP